MELGEEGIGITTYSVRSEGERGLGGHMQPKRGGLTKGVKPHGFKVGKNKGKSLGGEEERRSIFRKFHKIEVRRNLASCNQVRGGVGSEEGQKGGPEIRILKEIPPGRTRIPMVPPFSN